MAWRLDVDWEARWAVAAPNTGPAFVSTPFKPDLFAAEASISWGEFCNVMQGIVEDESIDLEAERLQLPSLKDLVNRKADGLLATIPVENLAEPATQLELASKGQKQLDPAIAAPDRLIQNEDPANNREDVDIDMEANQAQNVSPPNFPSIIASPDWPDSLGMNQGIDFGGSSHGRDLANQEGRVMGNNLGEWDLQDLEDPRDLDQLASDLLDGLNETEIPIGPEMPEQLQILQDPVLVGTESPIDTQGPEKVQILQAPALKEREDIPKTQGDLQFSADPTLDETDVAQRPDKLESSPDPNLYGLTNEVVSAVSREPSHSYAVGLQSGLNMQDFPPNVGSEEGLEDADTSRAVKEATNATADMTPADHAHIQQERLIVGAQQGIQNQKVAPAEKKQEQAEDEDKPPSKAKRKKRGMEVEPQEFFLKVEEDCQASHAYPLRQRAFIKREDRQSEEHKIKRTKSTQELEHRKKGEAEKGTGVSKGMKKTANLSESDLLDGQLILGKSGGVVRKGALSQKKKGLGRGAGSQKKAYLPRPKWGKAEHEEIRGLSGTLQTAFNPSRRGRYKLQEGEKPNKRQARFKGLAEQIEQEQINAFKDSAKDLQSVQNALEDPLLHVTPFRVATEGNLVRPRERKPLPSDGPCLDPEEILFRIEIRIYDDLHHSLREFLVPGSQKLIELRKSITCPADRNMASVRLSRKGAFFYIQGVFYLDKRSGSSNLVKTVKQFCADQGIEPPPDVPDNAEGMPIRQDEEEAEIGEGAEQSTSFKEMDMARVCWREIGLRAGPGARNVYCHQGCCEHLLVIKDVRRLHPDDPQSISAYPVSLHEEQPHLRRCSICSDKIAQKVTYDDQCAPHSPAFWCHHCYRLMHYDENEALLYDHKVFDYQGG